MLEPKIHPILNHFFSEFVSEHKNTNGMLIENDMNLFECETDREFALSGEYLVSDFNIHLDVEALFLRGPSCGEKFTHGGSFLAGRSVHLNVSRMGCFGRDDDPVVIIGLGGISIDVTQCAIIKNLVICLMEGATFTFNAEDIEKFENMKIIKFSQNGYDLVWETEHDWPTYEDYLKSTLAPPEKCESRNDFLFV